SFRVTDCAQMIAQRAPCARLIWIQLDRATQGGHGLITTTAGTQRKTVEQRGDGMARRYFENLRRLLDGQCRVAFEQPRGMFQRDLDAADRLCPGAHLKVSTPSLCRCRSAIRKLN